MKQVVNDPRENSMLPFGMEVYLDEVFVYLPYECRRIVSREKWMPLLIFSQHQLYRKMADLWEK